jgi:hypothetical protein
MVTGVSDDSDCPPPVQTQISDITKFAYLQWLSVLSESGKQEYEVTSRARRLELRKKYNRC